MNPMVRKALAETIGTGFLVFFGVGVATLTLGFHLAGVNFASAVVAIAFAFGLALVALVQSIGPVSGCHVNPAVTLGALLSGRMSPMEAVVYWISQFVGGILGALLLWGIFNTSPFYSTSRVGLGTDGWGAESLIHVGMGGAFLTEVVLTAVFVFVVLAVTRKEMSQVVHALVIGLTLAAVHLVGVSITGTSVNPARSLGPALIVGGTALNQVWLFIVAPLVGAIVAAAVHYVLYSGRATAGSGSKPEPGPGPTAPRQAGPSSTPRPAHPTT
jgi:aquaporin Z